MGLKYHINNFKSMFKLNHCQSDLLNYVNCPLNSNNNCISWMRTIIMKILLQRTCFSRSMFSFNRTVYLLLLILLLSYEWQSGIFGVSARETSNSLRGVDNSNSNLYDDRMRGNHIIRREGRHLQIQNTFLTNAITTQTNNLTHLIQGIIHNCKIYCADQTQYNGICMNKGCTEWKTGLRDGCSSICNGSEGNYREFYSCQLGCSKAIEEYYFRVTEVIGVPDPPTLISGSLKSSSLRLSWDGTALPLPYLAFTVQRRFYQRTNQWETIPSQQPLNQTNFTPQALKPFTEYQFRIGWILAHDFPPFYSLESNPIETLAKGRPNPPEITSIQPISNTSVAITWLPPTQPNGRLVAYILKLQKVPNGHAIIKEIPISQNPRGYTFSNLQPVTNYSLEISAQNLEGEGSLANIYFVTPQSSMSNEVSKRPEPRLLLQGVRDVYLQHLDLLMEPDVPVFTSTQNISAMAAHFKYKWVFVATGDGQIMRTGLERNESMTIVTKDRLELFVSFMSIDWLHNKLYIVGKKKRSSAWSIKRCDLNGDGLVTIYPYLNVKPIDFAADPFTGYLYWVSPPSYTLRGGLYKLDIISDEFLSAPNPMPVLEGPDLGPFTVDVANYRILIVHTGRNTILSVSLDGDVTDIRQNTQSPQYGLVKSLASYNGIFYWSTDSSVVIEEYNGAQDSFYHNSFDVPKVHQPLSRLTIVHPDLQPTPLPMAPPNKVQVLYGQTRARVSWRPPPSISGLGEGAWREWKYQLRISDNRSISNITDTEFIINDLRPSTFYTVQVLAYSPSGRGPVSPPIRGKTLRETQFNITLLWGSQSGLYSTNTLGENVQLLTNSPTDFKPTLSVPSMTPDLHNIGHSVYMWSLTWYESSVFFALSNGSVFYYDNNNYNSSDHTMTSKPLKEPIVPKVSLLKGVGYAQSIAFDYIGQKLYWSNPKQQTIFRCSISPPENHAQNPGDPMAPLTPTSLSTCGTKDRVERLHLVTMAREIAVDSYKGLLLWSTGHSIEMSRMNGYSHGTLYQAGLFQGIQIMGITLDTDQSRIYWITRSGSRSTLYRLSYNIRGAQLPMVIANYDDVSITGPIRYFNDRLIWLQGGSEAVITDLFGQRKSSLKISTINNVTNLHVKDQSSLRYPGGMNKHRVQVNPDPVMKWSVVISGKWNNFTIAWQPVNNTNYGKILYEVVVNNSISRITPYPNITIENSTLFKPYTEVEISLTSLTYWSSAKATVCRLKTPSWKPSEPQNPRVYIQRRTYPYGPSTLSSAPGNISLIAELRWDRPTNPNGLILGYLIHCWKETMKTNDCMCEVDLNKLSCEIGNLSPESKYHFAIQAYTDSGAGKLSQKVLADTGYSTPIPRLLITSTDKLEILDIDRNQLETIQLGYLSPISAVFLTSDKTVYWFNEGQDLMRAKVNNAPSFNKTRILTLSGPSEASHLAVDWIGRRLFWAFELTSSSMVKSSEEFKYGIMAYDLSSASGTDVTISRPVVIVNSKTPIKSVSVNPFKNVLYWTTSRRNGITTLFTSETNGTSPRPFLSRDQDNCNCSSLSTTGEAVNFDPHGFNGLSRGVLFLDHQSIWLSDENGCSCVEVVNISRNGGARIRSDIPTDRDRYNRPYGVAGDQNHVYWAEGYLYATEKSSRNGITELLSSGVREVSAFGPGAQPYPDLNCLIPQIMDPEEPLLFNHSSHSLHLNLPGGKRVNCSNEGVSMPTNMYEVYYGTVDENGISKCTPTSPSHCKVVNTLNPMLHITDLHPYTTYTVFVTLTNYYAQKEAFEPLLCSPIMLRTAPGAPMPPKLLRLEPLSPISIRVVWGQPEKLNGEKVWYEVHWKTAGSRSPKYNGQKWAETESRSNHNRTEFYLDLPELLPASNYTIWVVAFSEKGDAFSESVMKSVITFPHPNNITLTHNTPHNLSITWTPPNDTSILRHQIMYRDGWSSLWNLTELIDFTIPGRPYKLSITNLKPKTLYGFRIKTWYIGDPINPFTWPREGQFDFETLADKPGQPSQPIARGIGKVLYEVSWGKADENGAAIEVYALEYKLDPISGPPTSDLEISLLSSNASSLTNVTSMGQKENFNHGTTTLGSRRKKREWTPAGDKVAEKLISSEKTSVIGVDRSHWQLIYNGTDNRWEVEGLDVNRYYTFRVRARNIYGWGEYSQESSIVSLAALTLVAEPQSVGIIIGTILLAFIILGAFAILFIFLYRRKLKEKPALQSPVSSERREVELATLRELPGGSSFVQQSNILYAGGDLVLDLDLAGVPKISWAQISVTKFLGSGAFGEVYEGVATNLRGMGEPQTRVAIKTLRKAANQKEKLEFIQEAKLMTQFKHPHIIELLGICIDTDPCCLLLELMGGGDLLSYLRSNRPHLGSTSPLTLIDLLKMCVDVAKGCVCLEEMHFIHRDIAARNCLVRVAHIDDGSTDNRSAADFRVVKIGDFGLARDIYRNDYYKKHGEMLLPVRWMAPESLVDGVFTTQTDVWAFGILLWEIMTLGQQPYPAKNNVEVLNYVLSGGRLHRPPHCPDILGDMMVQCWEYSPDNRPSFKDCLNQLEYILKDFEGASEIQDLPALNDIHFDPYSYSEGGSESKSLDYRRSQSQNHDPDSAFLPPSTDPHGSDQNYPSARAHFSPPRTAAPTSGRSSHFPNYLEVLSDSNSDMSLTPLPSFTDQGYEIPLPKKPPRNPKRDHLSLSTIRDEIGLPPPSYWNAETLPIHNQRGRIIPNRGQLGPIASAGSGNGGQVHYRNLLASSTSEDADIEVEGEDEESKSKMTQRGIFSNSNSNTDPNCTLQEHHYVPNINNNLRSTGYPVHHINNNNNDDNNKKNSDRLHLRGIPCAGASALVLSDDGPFYTTTSANANAPVTNYNNHSYAAHTLNSMTPLGANYVAPSLEYRGSGPSCSNSNNLKNSHRYEEDSSSASLPSSPTEYSPFTNYTGGVNNGNAARNSNNGSSNNFISQYHTRPFVNATTHSGY